MTGRNVFENNTNKIADEDVEVLGDGPHIPLPELKEGYEYAITDLPSGRKAVVVIDPNEQTDTPEPRSCGGTANHAKYQACEDCGKYKGSALDTPESRTLRHRD